MKKRKGQVTIFIVIALIIVLFAILIYMFYPKISTTLGFSEENPREFIETCMKEEIGNNINIISSQGGSLNPNHYMMYDNEKIGYLCYTNEYYKTCIMQQPMLIEHIESEIQQGINQKTKECFDSLKETYEKRGYQVSLTRKNTTIELLPKRVQVTFEYPLTLTKGQEQTKYNNIIISINNNLYELAGIAKSILNWEARYGDAETTTYMNYYPNIKVEKKKQNDGSTIYLITERDTQNKFNFASRSVAWPPGYGAGN